MKHFLFVAAVFLAAAAGCDREPCAACPENFATRRIFLELEGSALRTKASEVPSLAESNVVRSTLYVFNRSGALVDSYSSSDGRFDFFLTDEVYDFVVVVNKAGLARTDVTESGLLATRTTLSENAVGNFVMVGTLAGHLVEADEKITVEVARLVGKVTYTVRTAFTGPLAAKEFRVEDIYLANVVGEHDLALSDLRPGAAACWYNRMMLDDPPQADCPVELLAARIGRRMAAADSLVGGHSFYPYPNECEDSHDREGWGSRCTRFVVKATLDGKTTWYPVTLAQVRRNCHYHVDLTISNYGVEHPEDPVSSYSGMTASVSVADWTDGGSLQGIY